MKHIRIFEEFTNTQSEGSELFRKYSLTLTEKAPTIKISTMNEMGNGEILDIKPTVTISGFTKHLDQNSRSMSIILTIPDGQRDVIQFDLIDDVQPSKILNIFKPNGYILEESELYKILDIFKDAMSYIGGLTDPNIHTIERTIFGTLAPSGEAIRTFVRKVVKI